MSNMSHKLVHCFFININTNIIFERIPERVLGVKTMNKCWELTDKTEHLFEVITIVFKNARTSKLVF